MSILARNTSSRGTAYSRAEVIHRYIHLVKYVAGRISVNLPPNVELNDLINDGVVGLIDAIEKYDDDRGVKFETYAITRIHGAIIDALPGTGWVPRAVRQKARELERAQHDLEAELGHQPTDDEVAVRLGVPRKELETLQQESSRNGAPFARRTPAERSRQRHSAHGHAARRKWRHRRGRRAGRGARGAGRRGRIALASGTNGHQPVLLRRSNAQRHQGDSRRFGVAGFANSRPSRHPSAPALARVAYGSRLP